MPMIWSTEADAKLLATIIQITNVKLTGAQMKDLATVMGPECTPKAISHRLTHFRKIAGDVGGTNTTNTPGKKGSTTPGKRGGKKRGKAEAEEDGEEGGEGEEVAESESPEKKIKTDPEEEGEEA